MTAILILADAFGKQTFKPDILYLATFFIDLSLIGVLK